MDIEDMLNRVRKGLDDIRCLTQFGSQGVHEMNIDRENYDVLFDAIETKAAQLSEEIESKAEEII